ncbi:MAG: right-handed parallel beta-helix repeat-containing protein, partial [bacterium]
MRNLLSFPVLLIVFSIITAYAAVSIESTPVKPPGEIPQKKSPDTVPTQFTLIPQGIFAENLTPDESPYLIDGSIIIPSGAVVNISPGVEIYIGGSYTTITVFGTLIAIGTKEETIVFRSVSSTPKPWDWDRIYFRSPAKSYLENVIIKHCNYGIYMVNGSVELKDCMLSDISLNAIYARNSVLFLKNISINKGTVTGAYFDVGAKVDVDSCKITGCVNGILCNNYSAANMKKLDLNDNEKALVLREKAAVNMEDGLLLGNRVGVMLEKPLKKMRLPNVKKNGINVITGSSKDFKQTFKAPEIVKTLGLNNKVKFSKKGFTPGLKSLKSQKAKLIHLIGSFTFGLGYNNIVNHNGEEKVLDNFGNVIETRQYKQTGYIPGLRPELQIFGNSQQRDLDLTINADFYNDPQVSYSRFKKNLLNVAMNWRGNKLAMGDYTENISEISMFSRRMLGTRFDLG